MWDATDATWSKKRHILLSLSCEILYGMKFHTALGGNVIEGETDT